MANNNAQNVSNKFVSISRPSKELIGLVLHRDHGFSVSLSFTVTEWLLLSRCLQQTTNRAEMKAIIRKAEPFHRLIDKSFEKLGTSKKVSYVAYVGSIDMSREIVPEQRRLTTCSADRTSYHTVGLPCVASGPPVWVRISDLTVTEYRSLCRDKCSSRFGKPARRSIR